MYNFQTWATSDFMPIEGQLVVFLALTGQMSHNCVWLGKYNQRVQSRACITDRTDIPKPTWDRMDVLMHVWNPQGPLVCPHMNLTEPVRFTYGIFQPLDQRTRR